MGRVGMMEEKIKQLIEEELARANEKFPPFHSAHEGWAVLGEEVWEVNSEYAEIVKQLDELRVAVFENRVYGQKLAVRKIEGLTQLMIAETIQVAAMARKFEQLLERSNVDGEAKV